MIKDASTYPYFMEHSFWKTLRIGGNSQIIKSLIQLGPSARKLLITEAIKGFYPISYASMLSFKRFSDVADDPESKAIAYMIYEVEKGDRPLIEGSEMTGILHCDQLKMMFESLINETIEMPSPESFDVLKKAKISDANIVKSMAICDIIENTAPYVIHFYQDFLIQCQVAFDVSSENVKRGYLDEHNLTEGDSCSEQHIEMLDKMKGKYQELEVSEEYEFEKNNFIELVNDHFSDHHSKILEILKAA